ncbi:hypothetical protein CVT26_012344 [Gymnopilus dilepis]|uniref:F-box domain-containing protein n=1 Tax=Gymnopilus dilepis TaxID=231916 RepID=A0A409YQ30_9AGAR|nr:hypothetical protein CVT26_012344 [Gymnopilus dilepis]
MYAWGTLKPILTTLCQDIIIRILCLLPAVDIISIRQTCKSLHYFTTSKIVWIHALQKVMDNHSISDASYPLREMSRSLLERIALSPHKFMSIVKKRDGGVIEPRFSRGLPRFLSDEEKEILGIPSVGRYDDIFLAVGGRFLATLSREYHSWPGSTLFQIWDLGLEPNSTIECLARELEPWDDLELRLFFPDAEVKNVFYLVSLQTLPET